jgi:hypothetical protein
MAGTNGSLFGRYNELSVPKAEDSLKEGLKIDFKGEVDTNIENVYE